MRNADETLGILAPRYGALSETFIRRHIQSILPGRTAVVARDVLNPEWCPSTPLLDCGRNPFRELISRALRNAELDPRSRHVRDFLKEQGVTVVMGEWLNFSAHWFPAVRPTGVRFFAHAHGYDVTEKALERRSKRRLYERLAEMDGIITVSNLTRERLISETGLNPELVHVIPCSADIPDHLPARRESGRILCLHVGRFVEKKGPLHTLKAFHQPRQSYPSSRLEMIGGGKLLPICQEYCREHSLSEVVTLHGAMPETFVKERLAQADVFLLHCMTPASGDEEGLPVAILEAMAHGLPVVSTIHAGVPEAVIDGQTGYLVDEQDVEGFGSRISVLASDEGLRHSMGQAGRARAVEGFSTEYEIGRLRKVLFGGRV